MEIDTEAKLKAEKRQLSYIMNHLLFIHFKFRAT